MVASSSGLHGEPLKWVRVLFQCWTQRTHYDEARYLLRLRDKGSPLLQWLAQNLNRA